ncbi:MAG: hypothetical protein KAG66_08200, partial [Methylococcales bacterium]|nr:hypothetical protein [Methylococcales bacterium]
MNIVQAILKRVGLGIFCSIALLVAGSAMGAALTAGEIQQYADDLGVVLTVHQQQEIAAIAKPDAPLPPWRVDAEVRIEQHRKADLKVQVVDAN